MTPPWSRPEPALHRGERHRVVCGDDRASCLTGVGIHAAGNVDAEHRRSGETGDGLCGGGTRCLPRTGAEEGVDDQTAEILNVTARCDHDLHTNSAQRRELLDHDLTATSLFSDEMDTDPATPGVEVTSCHHPIPAVVARPGHNIDDGGTTQKLPSTPADLGSSQFHELEHGDPEPHHTGVELGHLGGGEITVPLQQAGIRGQGGHALDYHSNPMGLVSDTASARRRPRWSIPLLVIAGIAILVGAAVGIRGLTGNPVRSVAADGSATLSGSFEPVACVTGCAQGYLQAGARSVFVRFPDGCPAPAREQALTVPGRAAPDLGKSSYRAVSCAG